MNARRMVWIGLVVLGGSISAALGQEITIGGSGTYDTWGPPVRAEYGAPVSLRDDTTGPAYTPPLTYTQTMAQYAYAAPAVAYRPVASSYTYVTYRPAVTYVRPYAVYPQAGIASYTVAAYPAVRATYPVTSVAYPAAAAAAYPVTTAAYPVTTAMYPVTTAAYAAPATPAPPAAVPVGPRVIVHPKVYVEGQPIRNLLRAITP